MSNQLPILFDDEDPEDTTVQVLTAEETLARHEAADTERPPHAAHPLQESEVAEVAVRGLAAMVEMARRERVEEEELMRWAAALSREKLGMAPKERP